MICTIVPICTCNGISKLILLVRSSLSSLIREDLHWSLDGRSAQHFGTLSKGIQMWPSQACTFQKHKRQRIHHISPHTSQEPWTLGYLKLKERFRLNARGSCRRYSPERRRGFDLWERKKWRGGRKKRRIFLVNLLHTKPYRSFTARILKEIL